MIAITLRRISPALALTPPTPKGKDLREALEAWATLKSQETASRQQYHGTGIAQREDKHLSACEILKQSAA